MTLATQGGPVVVSVPSPTSAPPWEMLPPQYILLLGGTALILAAIVLFPIARAIARRIEGRGRNDQEMKEQLAELSRRLQRIDEHQAELLELEERVDFTERMLAQQRNEALLARADETGADR